MLSRASRRRVFLADRLVVIQPSADDAVNRARYRYIDVLLDTLPYTGGDSTVAALDMGVPVVTRAGVRQAERMGLSILSHLGVTDTVAVSDDDYVAIACRLASRRRMALGAVGAHPRAELRRRESPTSRATRAAWKVPSSARLRSSERVTDDFLAQVQRLRAVKMFGDGHLAAGG